MAQVEFTACEHLDFSDNYSAKKSLIAQKNNETKVCWERPVLDNSYPSLVQFCKLRGRMNHPESCLCEANKGCTDYREKLHTVDVVE